MPLELRTVIPHFMAHIVKMKVRETSPIIAQERENLVFSFRTKIVIFRHQISSWLKTSLSEWWQTHLLDIPCGLVARIRRSHRRGRGSIPRTGDSNFASPVQCSGRLCLQDWKCSKRLMHCKMKMQGIFLIIWLFDGFFHRILFPKKNITKN